MLWHQNKNKQYVSHMLQDSLFTVMFAANCKGLLSTPALLAFYIPSSYLTRTANK